MPWLCLKCQKLNGDEFTTCSGCGAAVPADGDRVPFELVDRYRIIRVINTGGMGRVFRGWDRERNVTVAVKEMQVASDDPEDEQYAQTMFMQEVDFLGRLDHRALPELVDFFVHRQKGTNRIVHYLVMDYIEGSDLEKLMKERGGRPLDTDAAIGLFVQLLDVLSYLHTSDPQIVYRDLKPPNVMIRQEKVFLVDFGIAREYKPGRKGTLIGTPGYAAPEQYQGISQPRSDLYSLGVLMHYMLTGIDPEGEEQFTFTFDKIQDHNPDVPEEVCALIESMLSLSVKDRPATAMEALFQLDSRRAAACLLSSLARQAGALWMKFTANFIPGSPRGPSKKTRFHFLR